MKQKKEKRFEIIHVESHGLTNEMTVLRDKETDVQYLFVQNGYSGGLTPLLGGNQKNEL